MPKALLQLFNNSKLSKEIAKDFQNFWESPFHVYLLASRFSQSSKDMRIVCLLWFVVLFSTFMSLFFWYFTSLQNFAEKSFFRKKGKKSQKKNKISKKEGGVHASAFDYWKRRSRDDLNHGSLSMNNTTCLTFEVNI